jgi:hypothetical protein
LAAYVGHYENDLYGTLDVTLIDGRVHVRNGVLNTVAEVYDGAKHALRVELIPGTGGVIVFLVADNKVNGVNFRGQTYRRVK